MARKRERTFAAFGAILFLITSSALTIAAIVSNAQSSKSSSSGSNTSSSQNSSSSKKLAGTQLSNFTPTDSVPTLEAEDTTPGTGQTVKAGDTVTVEYTGAVASTGTIFQSSLDTGQPVTLPLNQVIKGWQEGIPGMKVGGTRRLLIPANLAYGANPPSGSNIPANANLVFDVTVLKIGS
ncbi:MAG TPA: FKBP-type peptidyl-prolyl cis-trans isomerase [Candidatus Sulfotelmatobacter sp.]|nr:FKBP-type peptidyl-prolyl cis-trans isomerase [Candidatus Sulfotelmatobacter sp.]